MFHVLDGNAWEPALAMVGQLGATDRKYGRPERSNGELWARSAWLYNRRRGIVLRRTQSQAGVAERLPDQLTADDEDGKYAQLLAMVRSAYDDSSPDQAMIDMDHVVQLVRDMGHPAYVEQTGGGCATIYAGGTWPDEHGDDRQMAVVGPGSFFGMKTWTEPMASPQEFYLGRDDDGATTQYDIPVGASDVHIAELIDAQIRASKALAEVGDAVARVKAEVDQAEADRPLVSDATIAAVAAMEERDREAGGPPWKVPAHPDNAQPGGWHHGQIR